MEGRGVSPGSQREHVHTGRLHTRIGNSVFKKSDVMSSMKKKRKNLKPEKINKHKYKVTKRCSEKHSYFEN